MALELRDLLFGPQYATWGVPATLTVNGTDFAIQAIDQTVGVVLPGALAEIETVRPVASILAGDLADLAIGPDDVDGGTIALNAKTWRINTHRMMPTPAGEADGEIWLLLEGPSG